jgi:hypothetical protein
MESYETFESEVEGLLDDYEFTEASLMDKKKVELLQLCKEFELPSYGTKADLIERLIQFAETELEGNVVTAESSITAVPLTKEEKDEVGRAIRR